MSKFQNNSKRWFQYFFLVFGCLFLFCTSDVTLFATVMAEAPESIQNNQELVPLQNIQQIVTGYSHTCALSNAGEVKCWGKNNAGQLGSNLPAGNVQAISAGFDHTCALNTSGGVFCWGSNAQGQLGDGALTAGVVAISAGDAHTCALTNAGGVRCWGRNNEGQLGDGSLNSGIVAIAAGGVHTCALNSAGGVLCWGKNNVGQLGNGSNVALSVTPVQVQNLANGVIDLAAGDASTCVVVDGGTVKCWGWNAYNRLGDGTTINRNIPVSVIGISSGASDVAIGGTHACVIIALGQLKCWGWNGSGELGNGTTASQSAPVDVIGIGDAGKIAVGDGHACALLSTGRVKCWGANQYGQLGDGTMIAKTTPVDVVTDSPAATVTPTATPTFTHTPSPTASATPQPATGTSTATPTSPPMSSVTPTATTSPTLSVTPTRDPAAKALVLVYAVLDNNLASNWNTLVNNIELGITDKVNVRLFIDGPKSNDAYIYNVRHDEDETCPSREVPTCGYLLAGNPYSSSELENSAHPTTLTRFISESVALHPDASQLIVALVGHGSGWSAGVLPEEKEQFIDQPRPWNGQPRPWNGQPGALLWDDHPTQTVSATHSLSIKGLDTALYFAQEATNRQIDLLYLDGCSLGMAEIAYEVQHHAAYMLASPNTDWASFTYHRLLRTVNPQVFNARQLGEIWLNTDVTAISSASLAYPYTYSLVDLSQMGAISAATTSFADALIPLVSLDRTGVYSAFLRTDHYDSNYNELIDEEDAYSDLFSFAYEIEQQFPDQPMLQQAAQALRAALEKAVISKEAKSGVYWHSGDRWEWKHYGGLGIYLPLTGDEERRKFYNWDNLMWAYATSWDEFLADYWSLPWLNASNVAASDPKPLVTCVQTTDPACQELAELLVFPNEQRVYLPVVVKQ